MYSKKTTLKGHEGSVLAMEYALANKWLFSSSGTWVHSLACRHHLIPPTVSGQYREGESVMSSSPVPVVPHTSRSRSGMRLILSPFTSWIHTFKPTQVISIRLLGRSRVRRFTLGAKTPLSNGSSLEKIQQCPRLAPSHVLFTSFLLEVTLNTNALSPWTLRVNFLPHRHRMLLPRERYARCSVYL